MPERMSKYEPLMAAMALVRVAKSATVVRVESETNLKRVSEPEGTSITLKYWLELNTWRCIKWWYMKRKPSRVSECQSALTKAMESAV